MTTIQFFNDFSLKVMATPHWKVMEKTVENSPWHREDNVAIHTIMTLNHYVNDFSHLRSEREQMITLMALLFHDFGKPEAEEVKEKKEQPGVMYRTYAGHEPVSANEMISFFCDYHHLREMFFEQGFDWNDIRKIKFMIEHHLPYGLERPHKRIALRSAIHHTLGEDEICFWDMLVSDCYGRISDDHDEKKAKVHAWIKDFKPIPIEKNKRDGRSINGLKPFAVSLTPNGLELDFTHEKKRPTLYMMHGVSGAGKSTWIAKREGYFNIMSEDDLRLQYAEMHLNKLDLEFWPYMTMQERYDAAWKFCHMSKESKYDQFAKAEYQKILDEGIDVVLDRMNQSRKGRSYWVETAKQRGYHIRSVEFFVSENTAKARQQNRGDKRLPDYRVHQIFMQQELPWCGPEVDGYEIVAP